jgi:hypothetical protein
MARPTIEIEGYFIQLKRREIYMVRSIKLVAIVLMIAGAITMILPANRSMAGDEYGMTSAGLGSAERPNN